MSNHIVVVPSSLSTSDPDAVREIYRPLKTSCQAATAPVSMDGIDLRPIGYDANRKNFEVAAQFAWQQRLIPKPLGLEQLFDEMIRTLD